MARVFNGGFWGWFLPLPGVLFVPVTALTYVIVNELANGVTGWAWAWVALAFLVDLAAHSPAAFRRQRRAAR